MEECKSRTDVIELNSIHADVRIEFRDGRLTISGTDDFVEVFNFEADEQSTKELLLWMKGLEKRILLNR